jgi:hypothetical protein
MTRTTLAVLLIAGCATMGDTMSSKSSGSVHTYHASFDRTWRAAMDVFHNAGSGPIEEHPSEHYMSTTFGVDAFSWGTYATAWVDPVGNDEMRVTIVTKKRAKLTIETQMDEGQFLSALDARLGARAER